MTRRTGIVFATTQEAGPFRACLAASGASIRRVRTSGSGGPVWEGESAGQGFVWTISGMGTKAARDAARTLLDSSAGELVSAGVSGALRPGLRAGDLVAATTVIDESGGRWDTDEWPGMESLTRALVLCSDRILGTAREKQMAHHRLGADVVDMESAGVALAAAEAGVPFGCVRAVSDAIDEPMPLDFTPLLRRNGSLSMPRLIAWLLYHPRTLPGLLALGGRATMASRRLAPVLVTLARDGRGIAASCSRE